MNMEMPEQLQIDIHKQDAVKKKLHDQKQALVKKQIDTYKEMLAKMTAGASGGKSP